MATHRWVIAVVSEKAASGMIEMSFPCRDKILRLARPAQSDGLTRAVEECLIRN